MQLNTNSQTPPITCLLIGMIHTSNPKASDWKVGIVINNQTVMFMMDTGLQCIVIYKQTCDHLFTKPLYSSPTKLVSFGGQHLQACGKTTILLVKILLLLHRIRSC